MYQDLLTTLLNTTERKLVIKDVDVTIAAIRRGLNTALTTYNQQMELCELPTIAGSVSVSTPKDGKITIKIISPTPQAKARFTIVTEDEPSKDIPDG